MPRKVRHQQKDRGRQGENAIARKVRPYLSELLSKGRLTSKTERQLKNESPQILLRLFKHSPRRILEAVLGRLQERSLSSLDGMIPTVPGDTLRSQVNWIVASAVFACDQVQSVVDARESFGRAALTLDFANAKQTLKTLSSTVGETLWGIQAGYLLAELADGFNENRRMHALHLSQSPSPFAGFFCGFYSKRAEAALSTSGYDSDCTQVLSKCEDDDFASYLKFKLQQTHCDSLEHLICILNFEECFPIPDRYFSLVDALRVIVKCSSHEVFQQISEEINFVASRITDRSTNVFQASVRPSTTTFGHEALFFLESLEAYTSGNYVKSLETASKLMMSDPVSLEPYEIVVKSEVRLGMSPTPFFAPGSLANVIRENMHRIVSRSHDSDESLRQLRVLAYRLQCIPIGPQLLGFCDEQSIEHNSLRVCPASLASARYPTPRFVLAIVCPESANAYLDKLDSSSTGRLATSLFRSIGAAATEKLSEFVSRSLPMQRRRKYAAFLLEREKNFQQAILLYREILSATEVTAAEEVDAIAGLYRCLVAIAGNLDEVAEVMVEQWLEKPGGVPFSALKDCTQQFLDGRVNVSRQKICWPLLLNIAGRCGVLPITAELQHDALEDFLAANHVTIPSELRAIEAQFKPRLLIKLLRDVCSLPVLQNSLEFSSQTEVEAERIKLCEWMREFAGENADTAEAEMEEIFRRSTIRQLTLTASRSRIFVDAERILQNLPEQVVSRALRALLFAKLEDATLKAGIQFTSDTTVFLYSRESLSGTLVSTTDEGLRDFRLVFDELRNRFLASNIFGLDANLSQRIRHGHLNGEIRARFETHHLLTTADGNGAYSPNVYWRNQLHVEDDSRVLVDAAFVRLSKRVDGIIDSVTNQWIQIRMNEAETGALFDFNFSDAEIRSAYQQFGKCEETSASLKQIIEMLWERTERILSNVRTVVTTTLQDLLFEAMNECQTSISSASSPQIRYPLDEAMTQCRTALALTLDGIAKWFQIDRSVRIPDFEASSLVGGVVNSLNRWSADRKIVLESEMRTGCTLPGAVFRPMWYLLSNLLENASKHSRLPTTPTDVFIAFDGGHLSLSVTNDCSPEIDTTLLEAKVSRLNAVPHDAAATELLRKEGGSGYVKVHNILKHDMRCSMFSVKCGIVAASTNKFFVKISAEFPKA